LTYGLGHNTGIVLQLYDAQHRQQRRSGESACAPARTNYMTLSNLPFKLQYHKYSCTRYTVTVTLANRVLIPPNQLIVCRFYAGGACLVRIKVYLRLASPRYFWFCGVLIQSPVSWQCRMIDTIP
jgi:hypothetical protein